MSDQPINQPADEPDSPPEKTDVTQLHNAIMREKLEPKDGYEPVPIWLVGIFAAVVFWGGYYAATYNGDFRSDFLDGTPRASLNAGPVGPPVPVDPIELGKRLFTANCVSCHGANGAGQTGQYPPLAGSEWVLSENTARLKRILLHGLEGPVKVKGTLYNGAMPSHGTKLNDERLSAVLSFIRTNKDWGNNAMIIKPEEVALARTVTKDRNKPWSEAELLAITQNDVVPTITK